MRVREAKDILVQHITEQAQLEGVSLTDLEKRMMYFTEGKAATEDPATLNDEFEAQYDTAKYEKKISHLMHHAYKRLRKENAPALQTWDQAIRRLKHGDHCLLVLWGERPGNWAPQFIGLIISFFVLTAVAGLRGIGNHIAPPIPRLLLGVFLAVVLASLLFPRAIGDALNWVLDRTLFRLLESEENGKDSN